MRTNVNVENVWCMREGTGKTYDSERLHSVKVAEELKKLRVRAGLSMAELAQQLGYKTASGYQRYENPEEYTKDQFPITFVHKLLVVLEGRGDPPIGLQDIMPLSGITEGMTTEGLFSYTGSLSPVLPSRAPMVTLDKLNDILTPESFEEGGIVRLGVKTHTPWIAVDKGYSSATFAVEISDNSMLKNEGGKYSFQRSDRIICDPHAEIEPSDFVIAVRYADKHAVFRRYRLAGYDVSGKPIIDLVAINSDYPIIQINPEHPGRIIARVMEHRTRL
jgi:hypothetical protein